MIRLSLYVKEMAWILDDSHTYRLLSKRDGVAFPAPAA